ncbi:hypothetical protein K1719_017775 [Acacia pycnantha]|nr:hypothetical protein K1719_017775 [Acacia pycnantha]
MKGSAKKKTGSEVPIDASNGGTSGDGEAAINGVADSLAPSSEKDNNDAFVQKGEEGEETPLQDSEVEDEEGSEEEDEDEDEEEEYEKEKEKKDGDKEGKGPKLDDDFYEVEAIRRKRMRKGQLQYLVKWSNWPESANTWEPLENLNSVPDVIDAFEKSLKSGKPKKRKPSHVVQHTQVKKRVERSATSYSLRRFTRPVADKLEQSAPLKIIGPTPPDTPSRPHTVLFADDGENCGNANRTVENGFANVSKKSVERNEEPDYDPKLSELKGTTINGNDADKVAGHSQEAKTSTGNGQTGGQCKVDSGEPGRCRGAKRRKSGSVKRFKTDSLSGEPVDTQQALSSGGMEHVHTSTLASGGNNSNSKLNDADTDGNIIKLLRPVGYQASIADGNGHNIMVTFVALRNDGAKVMVDNKYLKLNYPNMLINFYEQHLRYTPTPSSE